MPNEKWLDSDRIAFGNRGDTTLERTAANTVRVGASQAAPGTLRATFDAPEYDITGTLIAHTAIQKFIEEEITLSTGAATTDSTANLLPANSLIDAVFFHTSVAITTAVNFSLGDATTAARFASASTKIALDDKDVGILQWNPANVNAAGPVQTAAAKLRVTCNATPAAGKIKVSVLYRQFTAV